MWKKDEFRFPPYTYNQKFLVTDGRNVRKVSASEKEVMMGFPVNYTTACMSKSERKSRPSLCEDTRHCMIGNTFNIVVVSWLFSQLLSHISTFRMNFETLASILNGKTPSPKLGEVTLREPVYDPPPPSCSNPPVNLVLKLCRGSSFKGADIRLNDTDGSAAPWPRKPLPARLWVWKNVIAYKFTHKHGPEHINALELRAFLSMLKWRVSQRKFHHCRFLHLLDSQVCLSALAKGRSSSQKLAVILSQISSLQLFADIISFGAYVNTQDNPADKPSRGFLRRTIGKRKWVRIKSF
jgi:hypothetical protein